MNRISAIALFAIASLGTCSGAFAQDRALKANIPFDFAVGDTWMPAGEYTISTPYRDTLQFRSADRSKVATIMSTESYNESRGGNSEIVFDRYGNQYFLHQVLCPTVASLNLDVPKGKTEKRAHARALEASSNVQSKEVLVAAR